MGEKLNKLIQQAEQQKLQLEASAKYRNNFKLFSKRFPEIANKFQSFKPSTLILAADANGSINLAHKQTQQFFYGQSPLDFAKQQVDQFTKRTKVRRFRVTENEPYNDRHLHIPYLNAMLCNYKQYNPEHIEYTPKFVSHLIVTGVGLGYHLTELVERLDIQNIFIYEQNLDVFHGSLHCIDWQNILEQFDAQGKSLTLCIGESPRRALTNFELSIKNNGLHCHSFTFLFRHSQRKEELDFISVYQSEANLFIGGIGFFDDEQIGLAHGYHNLKTDHAVFAGGNSQELKGRVLIVGNGPSLDYHADYIKAQQSDCIVISCGSALGSLARMGIKPDFHVEMERTYKIADFISQGTTAEQRAGITLLCLHTVSPHTIELFDECCYGAKVSDAGVVLLHYYYKPKKIPELQFCNPTVTNCALSFATAMGFRDIHLIGVDLGVKEQGKHHSRYSYHYEMQKNISNEKEFIYDYHEQDENYSEGNFGGRVKTHKALRMSKVAVERLLDNITNKFPDLKCYNSNNGVKIQHAQAIQLAQIPKPETIEKTSTIQQIKNQQFLRARNSSFEALPPNKLLTHFFAMQDKLKMRNGVKNEREMFFELNRIYSLINPKFDYITHQLLRGSLNSFLAAIAENTMYLKDSKDFKQQFEIGRNHYNSFIDAVYQRMQEDPFSLDDTQDEILSLIKQKQSVVA